jgi:fatty acid/phospholipid biosynthesis enzyme
MRIAVEATTGLPFRFIQERHGPDTRAGAPLLGLPRPVIIAHGNTRVVAIARAIAVSLKLT